MKTNRSTFLMAMLAVALLSGSATAGGRELVWSGAVSVDWNDPMNWTPNGVPGPSDIARIPPDSGTIAASNIIVEDLILEECTFPDATLLRGQPGLLVLARRIHAERYAGFMTPSIQNPGDIILNASEDIFVSSRLQAGSCTGRGRGGDILVFCSGSSDLGGCYAGSAEQEGRGGDVVIVGADVRVYQAVGGDGGTDTIGSRGGDIRLTGTDLVSESAVVAVGTLRAGHGGHGTVRGGEGGEVRVSGRYFLGGSAYAGTGGDALDGPDGIGGRGGDITVEVPDLFGVIGIEDTQAGTGGQGNRGGDGGDVDMQARLVSITGLICGGDADWRHEGDVAGDPGDVTIVGTRVTIKDRGRILGGQERDGSVGGTISIEGREVVEMMGSAAMTAEIVRVRAIRFSPTWISVRSSIFIENCDGCVTDFSPCEGLFAEDVICIRGLVLLGQGQTVEELTEPDAILVDQPCEDVFEDIVIAEMRMGEDEAGPNTGLRYVELDGTGGIELDGDSLVILGTEGDDAGVVLGTVSLDGARTDLGERSRFLIADVDSTFVDVLPDRVAPLELSTTEGRSLWLVRDFTGSVGQDLDGNDDCILDTAPWSQVFDSVSITGGGSGACSYSQRIVGPRPDGGLPLHVYRPADAPLDFAIGPPEFDASVDSPRRENFSIVDVLAGTTGLGLAPRAVDVLSVNGSSGGASRTLEIDPVSDPVVIDIESPPGRSSARYAVWLWRAAPEPSSVTLLPERAGAVALPTPLGGFGPRPVRIANNWKPSLGGESWFPAFAPTEPAPYRLFDVPPGAVGRGGFDITVQGVIRDDFARNGFASVTNGVVVRFLP